VDLTPAVQDVDSFWGRDNRVTIKVGRALLKFGEVFDCFQGPLRAEQPLNVDSPERRRVDTVSHLLGTNVSRLVRGRIGTPILMAIKAGNSQTRMFRAAIRRLIELLLRKWRQQQPQAFQLFGIENAIKQRLVVAGGR
jgi:hypothetical protein